MTDDPIVAALAPPAAEPLTLARIQEYVWARYVEFRAAPFDVDEEEALALFEARYRAQPIGKDSECFYYGILAYERSFASGVQRRPYLQKAVTAFEAYRAQTTPDFKWEAVDDRYQEAYETLWPDVQGRPR